MNEAKDVAGARSAPEFFITPGYGEKLHDALHYSQAVRLGDRVETSGQGGWSDELVIPDAVEDEIVQAFDNVERTLATAGATWRDVVHVNSYHVSDVPDAMETVHNPVMTEQFRARMGERAPIWTQTGVARLGLSTMRIEIRVTAVVDRAG